MSRVLKIPDMSCEHCVKRISQILQDNGISDFKIDLATKSLTLQDLTEETLSSLYQALEEAGYPPTENLDK